MGRRAQAARNRRRIAFGGLAAGIAGVVGAAGLKARSHRRGRSGGGPSGEAAETEWRCQCGQEFRVSGIDRHRVYWLPDASAAEPVMEGRCPNCERPFPSEHAAATSAPAAS